MEHDVNEAQAPVPREPHARLVQKEHHARLPLGGDAVVCAPGHQFDVGRPGAQRHQDHDATRGWPETAARLEAKGFGLEPGLVKIMDDDVGFC